MVSEIQNRASQRLSGTEENSFSPASFGSIKIKMQQHFSLDLY
jgi:hypothetical protein